MSPVKTKTRMITETAALLAASVVLSLITFLPLPFGGSITLLSMLPIVIISYRYGTKIGLCTGFLFGLANILTGYHTVSVMFLPGDEQQPLLYAILIVLLDYVLAYTAIGLSGIFRRRMSASGAMCCGALVGLSARYLVHTVSGVLFYGAWAEWFFTQESLGTIGTYILSHNNGFRLSLVYSLIYNGTYMIPEIILTAIVAFIIGRIPVFKNSDLKRT